MRRGHKRNRTEVMRVSRRIIGVCMVLLLVLTVSQPVLAEGLDLSQTGSLSVTLTAQEEPMVGATLSVYPIATVTADAEENLCYDHTVAFKDFDLSLDDSSLTAKLDAYLPQVDVPFRTMTTDAAGTAVCRDLPLGLYFVKQTGTVEGFSPCTSFLVTVPGEDADGYVYEVNATPKTEVEKTVSVTLKKVWNIADSAEKADSVTLQLWRGEDVVKTAVLSEENNWQITYDDLPQSDAYRVKEVNIPKGFTASYQQKGYVFTVTNSSTLIQTGQLLWPIPALAVSGLLLLTVGVLLLRKKRKAHA